MKRLDPEARFARGREATPMRKLITLLVAAVCVTIAVGGVSAHGASKPDPTVAKLKKQVAALKRESARKSTSIRVRDTQLRSVKATLATRTGERDAANVQLAATSAALASVTTARDNALAGLPNAILAVPHTRFQELVLIPARQQRAGSGCPASYYSNDGYISYGFDLGKFCSN